MFVSLGATIVGIVFWILTLNSLGWTGG